jgi:RNA polymerase sigma factor (sigma-70 family)
MMRGRLERLFERWRKKRDVRALARVFDATSRELLELAGHVSHDPSEAEDLVQATFLAAIESADRFDMERDLVAWLVGILVREARMSRRRAARRPDPERLSERGEADPADAAERIELSEVLRAALERLPSPYREVVGPYVRDGASPSHIAHALGRSPGTVRVQIHRGLELVRRELPAGVVAGALLAVLPTRGLAAIRESVLARATSLAGSALATGAATTVLVPLGLGGLAVKKLAIGIGIAALGALAWNLLATSPRARATFPSRSDGAPATLASSVDVAREQPSVVEPESEALRTDEQSLAPQPSHELATLRLHLAWASDGSPAEGVAARLGQVGGAGEGEREAVADAAGVAAIDGVEAGSYAVRLDRVQVQEQVELEPGELEELRIEVPDGLTVQGHVIDAEGQGLAGAEVLLSEPWSLGGMLSVGRSESDGAFQIRGATANSTVSARLAGWVPALQPILHPSLAGAGPLVDIEVVLDQRSGAIAGRVLDPDGHPLSGAHLSAGIQMWEIHEGGRSMSMAMVRRSDGWVCRPPPPSSAVSGADGSFVLSDVEIGDVEVRVRSASSDGADPIPEWRQRTTVRAGETTQLQVRMAHGAAVEGVVRLSDGSPAAGAQLSVIDGQGALGQWAGCDASGAFRIAGLNAGELTLTVNDLSRFGHGPARAALEVADGATATWDVTLPKVALLAGVAVGEDWMGLRDWSVRIAVPNELAYDQWITTDAEGRFQLEAVDGQAYDLELRPPGSDREALPHAWLQGARPGDEIVLEVSAASRPSALVRGVLLGPDGVPPQGGHVALSRTEFPRVQVSANPSPSDGTFEVGPLPPGLYSMVFSAADNSGDTNWVRLEPKEALDVGVLQLKAPGDVIVRLRLPEGVPVEAVKVTLDGQGRERKPDRLASGAWVSRKVPAGLLTLTVEAPGCPQVRRDLELEEKGSLEVEVELVRGTPCPVLVVLPPSVHGEAYITLRVLDASGSIQQVFGRATDGTQPLEGLVLPPGTWNVEVQESAEGWKGVAQVIVESVDRVLPVLTIALEPPR